MKDFRYEKCGGHTGFYNNFFVANIALMRSPRIEQFLKRVDESGFIFTRRLGDALIQSTAIQLFVSMDKVHHFTSFAYKHTRHEDRLSFGILQMPMNDTQNIHGFHTWKNIKSFKVQMVADMQTLATGLMKSDNLYLC